MRLCQRPATIVTFRPVPSMSSSGLSFAAHQAVLSFCSIADWISARAVVLRQGVTHPVALGLEVALVELADADDERHPLGDGHAALLELARLLGVVGEQAHPLDAEILQDAGRRAVVAGVGRQAEREVRVERVEAVLLQAVRLAAC